MGNIIRSNQSGKKIENNGGKIVDHSTRKGFNANQSEEQPKNLVLGMNYKMSEPASEEYPDLGEQLTDGKYGISNYQDNAWQGYKKGATRSIMFDLGSGKSISQIKVNFLEQGAVGIHIPTAVLFYASNDKHQWSMITDINMENPWVNRPSSKVWEFAWDHQADGIPGHPDSKYIYARYIQVRFRPDIWAFIDEVEVWGHDGKLGQAIALTPDDITEPIYLAPGEESTNINNLALLYNGWYANGSGDWTKENLIPYISYVDPDGNPKEWMFDGVLYLGLKVLGGRRDFHSSASSAIVQDWEWYLDKTFAKSGDMAQLNAAVEEVSEKLKDPEHKLKTVLMIPYPSYTVDDFGKIECGWTSFILKEITPWRYCAEASP